MPSNEADSNKPNWESSIFTDIHFWVPVAVLIAGLLLLRFIR